MVKGLCILGSTGSIGQNTLRVVRTLPERFRIVALAAGRNLDVLAEQVREFSPQVVSVSSPALIAPLRERLGAHHAVTIVAGPEGTVEAATHPHVDFVVSAAHGVTGVRATYEAILAGKDIGLANKETLVVAGELVTRAARQRGVRLLPIDSEHNALHQCLRAGGRAEVRRLILTASGGPFRQTPLAELARVTPERALNHPTWKMGSRITVDSATMMNKGLEIIEAHWLFGLPSSRIDVLIHPQSIVHSMIEFVDGTVMAQLSVTDMRLPIQYALTYPERVELRENGLNLDLAAVGGLEFHPPERERFPCLDLARTALEGGGILPCALNAADEVAVEAFLSGRLTYLGIAKVIEGVLARTPRAAIASLDDFSACDLEARQRAREFVAAVSSSPPGT
jgi:1-deoxy-D-xylulose-5-phosphate reductoisomerase